MTESRGTVTSVIAFMKFMILPGAPLFSASVPIWKPGVSTSRTTGTLKESHSTRKSVILRQASASSAPPRCSGLFATMPTLLPPRRANPVTALLPKRGFSSNNVSLSTIAPAMRFMS